MMSPRSKVMCRRRVSCAPVPVQSVSPWAVVTDFSDPSSDRIRPPNSRAPEAISEGHHAPGSGPSPKSCVVASRVCDAISACARLAMRSSTALEPMPTTTDTAIAVHARPRPVNAPPDARIRTSESEPSSTPRRLTTGQHARTDSASAAIAAGSRRGTLAAIRVRGLPRTVDPISPADPVSPLDVA